MNQWWLTDFGLLARERQAIRELSQAEPWFLDAQWVLERVDLCVDATIENKGAYYPVRLHYPAYFPATPPGVWPQNRDIPRWSGHQYGAGGELCLEWGPDTWHPTVTGADVFISAHKLLSEENPVEEGESVVVPSRHQITAGQNLRSASCRLVVTERAATYLGGVDGHAEAELQVLFHCDRLVAFIWSVERDGQKWTNPDIPGALAHVDWSWRALVVRVAGSVSGVRFQSLVELREAVAAAGVDPARLDDTDEKGRHHLGSVLLVGVGTGSVVLFRIGDWEKGSVVRYETVVTSAGEDATRLGDEALSLYEKRVGIVGLGSAGSKIALMLARSGVRKFLLVDDDLFLPENLVRHTLDWRSVGLNKVDGVAFQLELVAAGVEVEVERLQVTGQESTASVDRTLGKLAACDLVVDATACGRTFGLLGSVAARSATAFVWLEVFEGGIGGLVGRFRPGHDPEPFLIRAQVASFLEEQEAPNLRSTGQYATEGASGEPLVASDADVSAISSHAARFALDILAGREPSDFPQSVYLVGLTRRWLFEAPFHTLPIDVGESGKAVVKKGTGGVPSKETVEFLKDIVERSTGG